MSRQRIALDSSWRWPGGDQLDRRHDLMAMLRAPMYVEGVGNLPAPVPPIRGGRLRLVHLMCPPCRQQVGLIFSYEVGIIRPGHPPYIWMLTLHPRAGMDPATGRPRYRQVETLLHDADNRVIRAVCGALRAKTPEQLHTTCPVHRALPFTRTEALRHAWKARQAILAAEIAGTTPKPRRWKLG